MGPKTKRVSDRRLKIDLVKAKKKYLIDTHGVKKDLLRLRKRMTMAKIEADNLSTEEADSNKS